MAEKMVMVPQRMLDEIEISRKKIFEIQSRNNKIIPMELLIKLVDITEPIWKLANTRWKEVK